MYKDKPHFAPRRTAPRKKWRPLLALLGLSILAYFFYNQPNIPTWQRSGGYDKGAALWNWMQTLDDSAVSEKHVDWNARREKVREAFQVSWEGYEKEAWGYDEYNPVSGRNKNMVEGGMGWIIVDSLDTMILMNLTSEVRHARQWISTSLQYDQDHDVSTFETTIRMLGGLLSAHYLSTQYPNLAAIKEDDVGAAGEDLYIEKATDLADRLMGGIRDTLGNPLEFKYMAKLTGEAEYWKAAERVMEVVDEQEAEDGLVPIYIHPDSGEFKGDNIRLGSRGDSYYEYLIKQYLQTSQEEPMYKSMWDESLRGIRKHLIAFTKDAKLMVLGERPAGLKKRLSPKMDHLVCFMPGTIALGATSGLPLSVARKSASWNQQREEEMFISRELMKTCWATYLNTKTGLAPEITHFVLGDEPVMMEDTYPEPSKSGSTFEMSSISQPLAALPDGSEPWRKDVTIKSNDRHNLQRPETVESLFYMYRVTGDDMYREWGWEMFKSFIKHTAVLEEKPPAIPVPEVLARRGDFWMAETLKYFYLLFSDRDFISLEEHVFNTEAHPFPRFKPSGDLKTGWQRKSSRKAEQ
ncbi:Mannosyl-oligosaccharide 1-2-alpha-mannosidase [Penicillium manginii]|uniref:Mannosyl-oligosaccharide 1-2-alpha-mannosidase n=1 Tax=Penicillium manginii TaxID=203109 RepID=UPI002548F626|nr:Mannosyl-oligosaccharide 1-2-alpha-mannosidase [Penicillium manginii]KAJ5739783.1 Mannosyl-oligosaccharide 1-2-alpha-mannosidase [Penicillium manginii]